MPDQADRGCSGLLDGLSCVVLDLGSEEGLVEAVLSLVAQRPAEVVVVSSGGGDAVARIRAAGLDVPVVAYEQRLFAGGARNAGIDHTRGRWVSFMAADCIAQPDYVAGRLRAHRGGALVVSGAMVNAYPESRSACASYLLLHHRRAPETPVATAATNPSSFDRAVFARVGRFRDDLRAGEDTEFLRRLPGGLRVRWAPEVRVAHRYPTTPALLVREQLARGRRRAVAERALTGSDHRLRVAFEAVRNLNGSLRQVRRTRDQAERRGLPLLLPGAVAYAVGALLAPPGNPDERPLLTRGSHAQVGLPGGEVRARR
jgi:glycosyltransferase involved in cell wall biosynthesis